MKQKYFLGFAFCFLLISNISYGQIISQYIETNSGTSPKGIEIWNNTSGVLDFSANNLVVEKGNNGNTPSTDFTLSAGTLAVGDVIVIGTSNMQATTEENGATFYLRWSDFNATGSDDGLGIDDFSIEAIKDYLGEGLKIDMDGQDIYLGNELFSFISETVNDINIRPVLGDFEITRGRVPDPTQLTFSVSTEEFSSLTDIPVYFYYSGHRIKNNEHFSDHNGMVSYPLGKITSKNPREYLQANLNLVGLSKEATEDPFVSKLVAKISGADARVNLTVKKPLIYIKSSELNFDDTLTSNVLANTFKQEFLESAFSVTGILDNADYLLDLSSNTEKISSSGGFYSASLNANIKFYDNQLNLMYTYQINNLKGVQLDYSKAGKDAYQKASEQIEKLIFRQLRRKVFD